MRVLVAEDNPDMSAFLKRSLTEEGFTVDIAGDGESALHDMRGGRFDVVILDWMMPRLSGLGVVQGARAAGVNTPVLFLTAKDAVEDVVEGLNSGADDYLTKPFKFAVLLARLHALTRRNSVVRTSSLSYDLLRLDLITRKTTWDGKELPLLPKEEAILAYFLRHPERPLSRAMIYENVWNDSFDGLSNTVEVHIKALRRHFDDIGAPRLIHTLRGRGYILSTDPDQ